MEELLNYLDWRISNAMSEGFNSLIQQLKAAARGFRSLASYRARILFFAANLISNPLSDHTLISEEPKK
ncbi:transposase [Prosthecobacter sp. SYSU 5D2]|uniref:transposase n=1 Tax=Prosthecobacter sp. SYSU 5D2 TaxID=3134134 RepID=UPI0031FF1A3C